MLTIQGLKLDGKVEKRFYAGAILIPIGTTGLDCWIDLYFVTSSSGEVGVEYEYNSTTGFEYNDSTGIRFYDNHSAQLDVKAIELTSKVGFNPNIVLAFSRFDLADIGVEVGSASSVSSVIRENSSMCSDLSSYLYLTLEALTDKTILGKYLDLDITKDIWDSESSPLRYNYHYERNSTYEGQVPECTYGEGILKLKVQDYENNKGMISYLEMKKIDEVGISSIKETSTEGIFELNSLKAGTYKYTITSMGYLPYTGYVKIKSNLSEDIGIIKLVKEGKGSIFGKLSDALTGAGVSEVSLTLFEGSDINRENEGDAKKVIFEGDNLSDSSGEYNINTNNGYYTLKMQKNEYEVSYMNVTVVDAGNEYNATLIPNEDGAIGSDIGDLRVVLTWGESPRDLDSHLCGPTINGIRRFHIYYADKTYKNNDIVQAFLDRDDTSSYGPETTTVYDINTTGKYSFYVHDYTNKHALKSTKLSYSEAKVEVYIKEDTGKINNNGNKIYRSKLIATYEVPQNVEGTVWHVFDYNAATKSIIPRNRMMYLSDSSNIEGYSIDEIELSDAEQKDLQMIHNTLVEK